MVVKLSHDKIITKILLYRVLYSIPVGYEYRDQSKIQTKLHGFKIRPGTEAQLSNI